MLLMPAGSLLPCCACRQAPSYRVVHAGIIPPVSLAGIIPPVSLAGKKAPVGGREEEKGENVQHR